MSNQRHAYLKAMGIDVWVERSASTPIEVNTQAEQNPTNTQSPVAEAKVAVTAPAIDSLDSGNINIPEAETATSVETLDWPALKSVVAECQNCELSKNKIKTLLGAGNQSASLMIIGDAPTKEDEQQEQPFSGEDGKLLTAMLKAMGFQRHEVYITNLVKCCTTENKEPSTDEVIACESYLTRQIKLIQPDLILALGGVTAQRLLKNKSTLSRLRGQLHYIDEVTSPVIVSFEPAYLLRSPNEKRKAWDDLKMAMKQLALVSEKKDQK